MLVQRGLDLRAVDVLAGAQDHVLRPVLDVDESFGIDAADVAAAEPAVDDHFRRRFGLVPVAADQVRSLEPDLARFTGRERAAFLVADLD